MDRSSIHPIVLETKEVSNLIAYVLQMAQSNVELHIFRYQVLTSIQQEMAYVSPVEIKIVETSSVN